MTTPDVVPVPGDMATGPARGQRIVILMAEHGRALTTHIADRLNNPELATNVPVLVLCELALRGPLRPRDLIGPTHLTSGAMTKQLDHLERLGLVKRSFGTVKHDRRSTVVTLTAKGHRAATTVGEAIEERLGTVADLRDELSSLLDE